MEYFIIPNKNIAVNRKVASSSIVRSIIQTYYPEIESSIQSAHYPNGKNADNSRWHGICPKNNIDRLSSKMDGEVILIVRNPIERFISSCAEYSLSDIDEVLSFLENGSILILQDKRRINFLDNPFFCKQSSFLYKTTKCYKYESHLENFCTECGLPYPMLTISETIEEKKPVLTETQQIRILEYYSEDKLLWDSITQAGFEVVSKQENEYNEHLFNQLKSKMMEELDTNQRTIEEIGIDIDCSDISGVEDIVRMRTAKDARSNYNEIKNLIDLIGESLYTISIWDVNGNEYELSTSNALTMLGRYAGLAAQQQMEYFRKQSLIYKATTIEELESIAESE